MPTRFVFFIWMGFFLIAGCHMGGTPPSSVMEVPTGKKVRVGENVPPFQRLMVEGNINLFLKTGKPRVEAYGFSQDVRELEVGVKQDTLYVRASPKMQRQLCVTVYVPKLQGFAYRGHGRIDASHIRTEGLQLSINNDGNTILGGNIRLSQVRLAGPGLVRINNLQATDLRLLMGNDAKLAVTGVIRLRTLTVGGYGSLHMYWIDSPNLTVRAKGKTRVSLAGVVNKLDVELWADAIFNARYLRARSAFIKTHERSVASITTLAKQHALALDASNIYFYEIPEMKASFMAKQGSILDMRDWSLPELKDYDRFNK